MVTPNFYSFYVLHLLLQNKNLFLKTKMNFVLQYLETCNFFLFFRRWSLVGACFFAGQAIVFSHPFWTF